LSSEQTSRRFSIAGPVDSNPVRPRSWCQRARRAGTGAGIPVEREPRSPVHWRMRERRRARPIARLRIGNYDVAAVDSSGPNEQKVCVDRAR